MWWAVRCARQAAPTPTNPPRPDAQTRNSRCARGRRHGWAAPPHPTARAPVDSPVAVPRFHSPHSPSVSRLPGFSPSLILRLPRTSSSRLRATGRPASAARAAGRGGGRYGGGRGRTRERAACLAATARRAVAHGCRRVLGCGSPAAAAGINARRAAGRECGGWAGVRQIAARKGGPGAPSRAPGPVRSPDQAAGARAGRAALKRPRGSER